MGGLGDIMGLLGGSDGEEAEGNTTDSSGGLGGIAAVAGIAGGPVVSGGLEILSIGLGLLGPGYTPSGGGEVKRQLASDDEHWAFPPNKKNVYFQFLELYHKDIWNAQVSMWNVPKTVTGGHPSAFNDFYMTCINNGWVDGTFFINQGGQPELYPVEQNAQPGKNLKSDNAQDLLPPDATTGQKVLAWMKDNTWLCVGIAGVVALGCWLLSGGTRRRAAAPRSNPGKRKYQ